MVAPVYNVFPTVYTRFSYGSLRFTRVSCDSVTRWPRFTRISCGDVTWLRRFTRISCGSDTSLRQFTSISYVSATWSQRAMNNTRALAAAAQTLVGLIRKASATCLSKGWKYWRFRRRSPLNTIQQDAPSLARLLSASLSAALAK